MALYETTFVARPDMSQADVDRLTKDFSGIVEERGGKVIKKEYWGLRSLAYQVKKNRKGHYVMLGVEAPATAVTELERKYRLSEDIIRSLTIRVEEIANDPSPILSNSGFDGVSDEG
jgi:small subunit ribosomal protein S6